MQEPSILDFLKSKLNPGESPKIELPEEPKQRKPSKKKEEPPPVPAPVKEKTYFFKNLPWRSLLALGFMLFAQVALNPTFLGLAKTGGENVDSLHNTNPTQAIAIGTFLYFSGFLFLLWAVLSKEWTFEDMPAEEIVAEPMTLYTRWLWVALPLGAGLLFCLRITGSRR
jgi:hypothetical protein